MDEAEEAEEAEEADELDAEESTATASLNGRCARCGRRRDNRCLRRESITNLVASSPWGEVVAKTHRRRVNRTAARGDRLKIKGTGGSDNSNRADSNPLRRRSPISGNVDEATAAVGAAVGRKTHRRNNTAVREREAIRGKDTITETTIEIDDR